MNETNHVTGPAGNSKKSTADIFIEIVENSIKEIGDVLGKYSREEEIGTFTRAVISCLLILPYEYIAIISTMENMEIGVARWRRDDHRNIRPYRETVEEVLGELRYLGGIARETNSMAAVAMELHKRRRGE